MKVRQALLPLFIASKVFCVNPFSRELRTSISGSLLTVCGAIGYTIFHLCMINLDVSVESNKNFVAVIIDSYNRYSGFSAFCVIVISSILTQNKIIKALRMLETIDCIFDEKFGLIVDNQTWQRYFKKKSRFRFYNFRFQLTQYELIDFHQTRNVFIQICVCLASISLLEWRNCLMHIQDSVPFSEHCIIMCLGECKKVFCVYILISTISVWCFCIFVCT